MSSKKILSIVTILFFCASIYAKEKHPKQESVEPEEAPVETPVEVEVPAETVEEPIPEPEKPAYDEDSAMFFLFNTATREDFEIMLKVASVQEQTVFQIVGFAGSFSTFVELEPEEMTEKDKAVYDLAISKISSKFKDNDIAVGLIINEMDLINGKFDGWGIISHRATESDILSQVYYFSAEF